MARPEIVGAAELVDTFLQALGRAVGQALDRAQALAHATGTTDTIQTLLSRLIDLLSRLVAWESLAPLERGLLALLLGVAVFLAWPAVRDAALGLVGLGLETLGGAAMLVVRLRPHGDRRPGTVRQAETLTPPGTFSAAAPVESPPVDGFPAPAPASARSETAGWPGFRTLCWQRRAETEEQPAGEPGGELPSRPASGAPAPSSPPAPETPPAAPTVFPHQETGGGPVTDASGRPPSPGSAAEDDLFAEPDLTASAEEPSPTDIRDESERAIAWLRAYLQDGPRPAREVYQAAQAVGIADRTLRRAMKAAGIQARWDGRLRVWVLPTHPPRPEER